MKLLDKSLRPFVLFSLFAVVISIPLFYWVVQAIYIRDADESLQISAKQLQIKLNLSNTDLPQRDTLVKILNQLELGYYLTPLPNNENPTTDRFFTEEKYDAVHGHVEPFRVLQTTIVAGEKTYALTARVDMEEYYDVIPYTALLAGGFFFLILAGYFWVNKTVSKKVWDPFLNTLAALESFNINSGKKLPPMDTDIIEFKKLSGILQNFISRNAALYEEQKKFTENAAHELQTPLSLILAKTDLMLQAPNLTSGQMEKLDEIKQVISRMKKINSNLLLLAKIENSQFPPGESLLPDLILKDTLFYFKDTIEAKNIIIVEWVDTETKLLANRFLVETLFHNLIGNAIRHSVPGSQLQIHLVKNQLKVTNPGIHTLKEDMLFRRFSKENSGAHQGGLGLAIAKEICLQNHWQIGYAFEKENHVFTLIF